MNRSDKIGDSTIKEQGKQEPGQQWSETEHCEKDCDERNQQYGRHPMGIGGDWAQNQTGGK